jgi:formate transporter
MVRRKQPLATETARMPLAKTIEIDAYKPAEIARRIEAAGVAKAGLGLLQTVTLGVLAGAFIAFGALFFLLVMTESGLGFGPGRWLGGLAFSLGLVLVVIAGAELFTGNNLIVMAWAAGKVTTGKLMRNWGLVYAGNFVGSVGTAVIMFFTHQHYFGNGAVGAVALNIANTKVNLDFVQAVALGIMCNVLVCLAVWMTFSARTTEGKILAIIFPISAFVAAGFEHCVANMYFIPIGLLIKEFDPAFAVGTGLDLSQLTWFGFFVDNLLPVTVGNIIGGAVMVAAVYWFIYLRPRQLKSND